MTLHTKMPIKDGKIRKRDEKDLKLWLFLNNEFVIKAIIKCQSLSTNLDNTS
jgi:hypothetical protein